MWNSWEGVDALAGWDRDWEWSSILPRVDLVTPPAAPIVLPPAQVTVRNKAGWACDTPFVGPLISGSLCFYEMRK